MRRWWRKNTAGRWHRRRGGHAATDQVPGWLSSDLIWTFVCVCVSVCVYIYLFIYLFDYYMYSFSTRANFDLRGVESRRPKPSVFWASPGMLGPTTLGEGTGYSNWESGAWSGNVPPSLVQIMISNVGTARDQSLHLSLLLISEYKESTRVGRATKCESIPKIIYYKTKLQY